MRCIGCQAEFAHIDGPTHEYMLSSPGCWAAYGEVLAREYSDNRLARLHRLTVDTLCGPASRGERTGRQKIGRGASLAFVPTPGSRVVDGEGQQRHACNYRV